MPEELNVRIEYLKDIATVNTVDTANTLDIDVAKNAISYLSVTFVKFQEQFDIFQPLKIHIIMDHLEDYFELTGRTLLDVTDETVEAAHSKLSIFYERHGYKIKHNGCQTWKNP